MMIEPGMMMTEQKKITEHEMMTEQGVSSLVQWNRGWKLDSWSSSSLTVVLCNWNKSRCKTILCLFILLTILRRVKV